jgi:hypothetical protein
VSGGDEQKLFEIRALSIRIPIHAHISAEIEVPNVDLGCADSIKQFRDDRYSDASGDEALSEAEADFRSSLDKGVFQAGDRERSVLFVSLEIVSARAA